MLAIQVWFQNRFVIRPFQPHLGHVLSEDRIYLSISL